MYETLTAEHAPSLERKVASDDVREALGSVAVRSVVAEQMIAERSYDIAIEPAGSEEDLNDREIARRLETDHVVKQAPGLYEQAHDDDRTNVIYRVAHQTRGLGTFTSDPRFARQLEALTEHDVLQNLQEYLQTASTASSVLNERQRATARDMLESGTFIGKQEYEEAAMGIADYWKQQLTENPDLQILAVTGNIADRYAQYDGPRSIKSDEYLLDTILDYFSDDDCEAFAGRLITDASQISVENATDLKAVLLDDRIVSGTQISDVRDAFAAEHPQFASSVEVQVVVANNARLTQGLAFREDDRLNGAQPPTPVRAYYQAHDSAYAQDGAGYNLAYSGASDYGGEDIFEDFTVSANKAGDLHAGLAILQEMPAAANIVRPYRQHGAKLTNAHRLARFSLGKEAA